MNGTKMRDPSNRSTVGAERELSVRGGGPGWLARGVSVVRRAVAKKFRRPDAEVHSTAELLPAILSLLDEAS